MDERSAEEIYTDQPYTVHHDVDRIDGVGTDTDTAPVRRSGPDPLALVAGLTAIVIAVLALTGALASVDPGWILALGAVGVGCAVLVVTLRRR